MTIQSYFSSSLAINEEILCSQEAWLPSLFYHGELVDFEKIKSHHTLMLFMRLHLGKRSKSQALFLKKSSWALFLAGIWSNDGWDGKIPEDQTLSQFESIEITPKPLISFPPSLASLEKKRKKKTKNINKNKKQSQKQNQKQKLLNHDCRMYIILQDVMLQDLIIKA